MALYESYIESEFHPIDIAEQMAAQQEWQFERLGDDQIAMVIEAQWRSYSITLDWSACEESLRLVCSFEMDPPEERLGGLNELLNGINSTCWSGTFSYWAAERLMVYRYGLVLSGGQVASPEQIDTMIRAAVQSAERYYPAIQLLVWSNRSPREAMQVAMAEAYGHA
ncbi:type III secretion system chaperone family protein [Pontibaca methylaminivorans]|uniref:Diacylglyceryl transferase n=1 Tax=Pontibaca methylaminivorans TaxID=515897 RepID=A0A1R3WUS7_9RHOB|nr:YbjN domain-containing protein [Pontibaca methylaminivorans]SIT81776.1 hypothetical protein SAMN05421849_1543 [Pontibaca methylaminivorans]